MPQRWEKHHYVPFYRGGTKRMERKNPKQIHKRKRKAFPHRRDVPPCLSDCRQLNFLKPSNSQFLENKLKVLPAVPKKKSTFKLGFAISRLHILGSGAWPNSQLLKNLSWTEGDSIWWLFKVHSVILEEQLLSTDSHLTFWSQWRRDKLKLPLTW